MIKKFIAILLLALAVAATPAHAGKGKFLEHLFRGTLYGWYKSDKDGCEPNCERTNQITHKDGSSRRFNRMVSPSNNRFPICNLKDINCRDNQSRGAPLGKPPISEGN